MKFPRTKSALFVSTLLSRLINTSVAVVAIHSSLLGPRSLAKIPIVPQMRAGTSLVPSASNIVISSVCERCFAIKISINVSCCFEMPHITCYSELIEAFPYIVYHFSFRYICDGSYERCSAVHSPCCRRASSLSAHRSSCGKEEPQ